MVRKKGKKKRQSQNNTVGQEESTHDDKSGRKHADEERGQRGKRLISYLWPPTLFGLFFSTIIRIQLFLYQLVAGRKPLFLEEKIGTAKLKEQQTKEDSTENNKDLQNKELKETNAKLTDTIKEQKEKNENLEDKNKVLTKEIKELTEESKKLTNTVTDQREENENMKKTNEVLTKKNKDLTDESKKLTDTITKLKKQNETTEDVNDDLTNKNKELTIKHQQQVENLQHEKKTETAEHFANISRLKQENQKLEEEKQDALRRFSELVSVRLRDNNPNIVDLNDQCRPTKLAEMFSELYDNEWTCAYDVLEGPFSEENAIVVLLDTVMIAYDLCEERVGEPWQVLTDWFLDENLPGFQQTAKWLKDSRKTNISKKVNDVKKDFTTKVGSICKNDELKNLLAVSPMTAYFTRCIELCLLMVATDPPLVLECPGWKATNKQQIEDNKVKKSINTDTSPEEESKAGQVEERSEKQTIHQRELPYRDEVSDDSKGETIKQAVEGEAEGLHLQDSDQNECGEPNKDVKVDGDENEDLDNNLFQSVQNDENKNTETNVVHVNVNTNKLFNEAPKPEQDKVKEKESGDDDDDSEDDFKDKTDDACEQVLEKDDRKDNLPQGELSDDSGADRALTNPYNEQQNEYQIFEKNKIVTEDVNKHEAVDFKNCHKDKTENGTDVRGTPQDDTEGTCEHVLNSELQNKCPHQDKLTDGTGGEVNKKVIQQELQYDGQMLERDVFEEDAKGQQVGQNTSMCPESDKETEIVREEANPVFDGEIKVTEQQERGTIFPHKAMKKQEIGDERLKFNKEFFKEYTKRGNFLNYIVWPTLCLHKNGPLLSKGVAQGTKEQHISSDEILWTWRKLK